MKQIAVTISPHYQLTVEQWATLTMDLVKEVLTDNWRYLNPKLAFVDNVMVVLTLTLTLTSTLTLM